MIPITYLLYELIMREYSLMFKESHYQSVFFGGTLMSSYKVYTLLVWESDQIHWLRFICGRSCLLLKKPLGASR